MNNKFENENEKEKLFKKRLLDRTLNSEEHWAEFLFIFISKALYPFSSKFSYY